MIVTYGGYSHDDNECWFTLTKRAVHSNIGRRQSTIHRWVITGVKRASSQSALTSAIAALENAYSFDDQDLIFTTSGGGETAHSTRASSTLTGIKVRSLTWLDGTPNGRGSGSGTEYVLRRTFQVVVDAEMAYPGASNVLFYREHVRQIGTGGPRRLWVGSLLGVPQEQVVQQKTTFRAIQHGYAVGLVDYPIPPAPLFPDFVSVNDQHEGGIATPQRFNPLGNTGYPVDWKYVFESPNQLTGGPSPLI